MRSLAFLLVLAELLFLGPLYLMYGQVDPCRALAKDLATRADKEGGIGTTVDKVFGDLEVNARKDVADKSTMQCSWELLGNWTGSAADTVTGKDK